jgi:hypothetical protein
MAGYTLSLSPSTNPFPFSALVTAAYVAATINFDPEVANPILLADGKEITDIGDIVTTLGLQVAGSGDSTKVLNLIRNQNEWLIELIPC